MKKHVFGFALFCSIVGSAIVAGHLLFVEPPTPAIVYEVTNHHAAARQPTHCWKMKQNRAETAVATNVEIEQAVFDAATKQLKTSLSVRPRGAAGENFTLALHLFVKDGKTSRYVSTESVRIDSMFGAERESLVTTLERLEKLESHENLYVVPEISGDGGRKNYKENPPRFDYANATAVTVER